MAILKQIRTYWLFIQALFDINSGAAMGLLSMGVAWAIFHGRDIGAGSAAAYASAIAAFASSNIMRPRT